MRTVRSKVIAAASELNVAVDVDRVVRELRRKRRARLWATAKNYLGIAALGILAVYALVFSLFESAVMVRGFIATLGAIGATIAGWLGIM